MSEPIIGAFYRALLHSDRVSKRTREILLERAEPAKPSRDILDDIGMATLRAVMARIVPQSGPAQIDLATRALANLESGGDGWRFTDLPSDALAYPAGLRTLNESALADTGHPFAALDESRQDILLTRAADGELGSGREARPGWLSAAQMKLWFEDLRSDAVRLYVSHPATLARMGYSGIANGGDGPRKQGFVQVGIAEPEAWEPPSERDASR